MTVRLHLCALAACLIPAGMVAADDTETEAPRPADPEALSNKLDQLVQEAISEGLLTATDPGGAAEDAQTPADAPVAPVVASVPSACAGDDPFDFSLYAEVTRYQDLHAFKPDAADLSVPEGRATEDRFIKAFLALGLNTEALTLLAGREDPSALALRELATLMHQRSRADIEVFRELSACRETASLWLSIALLVENDPEGAALLNEQLNAFRQLPIQLRVSVTEITIPVLIAQGDTLLANKMMATFTAEEFRVSSRLQFQRGLMEMELGSADGEEVVRSFLSQPQFRDEALVAMVRNARPVDRAYRALMLDDIVQSVARARTDTEIAEALSFALSELSAGSRYTEMAELYGLPTLQPPPTQGLILDTVVDSLTRDLGSDEAVRNLSGIDGMIETAPLLEARSERAQLHALAVRQAARFGFVSLAEHFFEGAGSDVSAGEALASLAFRRGNDDLVYRVAERFADEAKVNQFAALSAVRSADRVALSTYSTRLELDPAAALALVRQDAASGHWIVPDRIYLEARRTDAPEIQRSIEEIMVLRKIARTGKTGPERIRMASVTETLDQAGEALASMRREVR